jgi:hypothetical protein
VVGQIVRPVACLGRPLEGSLKGRKVVLEVGLQLHCMGGLGSFFVPFGGFSNGFLMGEWAKSRTSSFKMEDSDGKDIYGPPVGNDEAVNIFHNRSLCTES